MQHASNSLILIQQILKFYESCLEDIRSRYSLTGIEIKIISFLHNNPGHDTVGDIAQMRMLSKGNVSTGAESLIQKGLLQRRQDPHDRRWVHLILLPAADPIIQEIEAAGASFLEQLFDGFSAEEYEIYKNLNDRLAGNIRRGIAKRSDSHAR